MDGGFFHLDPRHEVNDSVYVWLTALGLAPLPRVGVPRRTAGKDGQRKDQAEEGAGQSVTHGLAAPFSFNALFGRRAGEKVPRESGARL